MRTFPWSVNFSIIAASLSPRVHFLLTTWFNHCTCQPACLSVGEVSLRPPVEDRSYDVLVFLHNVLHMAARQVSKLQAQWCFCSTWIILKWESVHTAASNKPVMRSTEAPHQPSHPGLPGTHLQIIYCETTWLLSDTHCTGSKPFMPKSYQ